MNVSDNLTENMNETMSKLSPREERAIIKETLKKDYKCEFHQISDTKSIFFHSKGLKVMEFFFLVFKNEHVLYIINSKWLRIWTEFVNMESDLSDSKSLLIFSFGFKCEFV